MFSYIIKFIQEFVIPAIFVADAIRNRVSGTSSASLSEIDLSLAKCKGLDIRELTIKKAQKWFRKGRLTPLDLTKCYIERIAKIDPFLNSVIETNPDAEEIAKNLPKPDFNKYPLWGIPILVKDNIATTDLMNTTAGSFLLLESKPKHEATVIKFLRKAGAIILGKTNMSEFSGYRSLYFPYGWSSRRGQTINPYNSTMTTYGSSSGSAVAVSANLAMASLATDTCGSLITPAAAGMVVGSKASYGRVSNSGVVPLAPSIDSVGVMARTVEDNLVVLDAISYHSPPCYKGPVPKVGVVRYPYMEETTSEIVSRFDEMVMRIKAAEFKVVDKLTLPQTFYTDYDYVELKHYMTKYLNTTKGNVTSLADIIEINQKYPTISGLDQGYLQDNLIRAQSLHIRIDSQSYTQARHNLKYKIPNTIRDFMNENNVNVLMVLSDNDLGPYIPASLAGLPIISLPAGISQEGFPFGISFYTVPRHECLVFKLAKAVEATTHESRITPTFL